MKDELEDQAAIVMAEHWDDEVPVVENEQAVGIEHEAVVEIEQDAAEIEREDKGPELDDANEEQSVVHARQKFVLTLPGKIRMQNVRVLWIQARRLDRSSLQVDADKLFQDVELEHQ